MLFLDMEKAFDRVSYDHVNESLEVLGFGPRFRWRVYANGQYCVPTKWRRRACMRLSEDVAALET